MEHPERPKGIDAHRALQEKLADLIEEYDKYIEAYGGSRFLSLAKTSLEQAGLWLLAEEGASSGSSLLDGLRGI